MGKAVLVTGAGRGLGRRMAVGLVRAGFRVFGTTNTHPEDAGDVMAELGERRRLLTFLHLDVADFASYGAFTTTLREHLSQAGDSDHLDCLVNNAGIGTFAPFEATSMEQFDRLLSVNLKAPYFLTQTIAPLMPAGGRILNVTTAITRGVVPGLSAYAASKGAVEVLTRYQASELAARGLAVNCIMGGAVNTGFGDGMMELPTTIESAAQHVTWGRMAEPDEIADAVPAILSDSFRWATGSCIDLSGGQSI